MEYLVETQFPEYAQAVVTEKELPGIYEQLKDSATVTWNDGGDDVLIIALEDDYSVISLLTDDTPYYLTVSNDEGEVLVDMAGNESAVPRKALAPRKLGLTVLLRADDLPGLRTDYTWCEQ